jgi:hypothetical protein
MRYTQLPTTYKYDVIAEAIYARELEYFHYDFDCVNFEHMLASLPEGPDKDDIRSRLSITIEQMQKVELIINALKAQIDDAEAYSAAVERMTAKRLAASSSETTMPGN